LISGEETNIMNTKFTIGAATMAVGVMFGALGNQAIHAQAGKKVYQISEYTNVNWNVTDTRAKLTAAGGIPFNTANGKVTAVEGKAPAHVGIVQWNSLDAALNFAKSKDAPKADRRYLVEAE
jgi:hypothetical protein